MDLNTFKSVVEKMIIDNGLNISLSGVALVASVDKELWSASFIYERSGMVPAIDKQYQDDARNIFQKFTPQNFVLGKLQYVEFVTASGRDRRWQVQYLFRPSDE